MDAKFQVDEELDFCGSLENPTNAKFAPFSKEATELVASMKKKFDL